MKLHVCALVAVLAASPVAAEGLTFYVADQNGARVVPAAGSGGSGLARVTLNEAETQIFVSVYFGSLGASAVAAHIHGSAGPGVNAPVLFTLPPPTGTSGSIPTATFAVTPSQVTQLKAGLWYLDIHTTSFPAGEIRGQLEVSPVLATTMSPAQAGSGVGGNGRAWVSFNEFNNIVLVSYSWNLTHVATGAHLHAGRSGTAGGAVICDLTPGGLSVGEVRDRLCVVSPAQAAALRSGQVYIDVHSPAAPAGHVRGQIKRTFNPCDFDGDGRSDKTIVRNNGANLFWWILLSNGGVATYQWGTAADFSESRMLCPDIDGDGKADPTIFRNTTPGFFWTLQSSNGGVRVQQWGMAGDDARMIGDYDGDGRDDYTIYRAGAQSQYWTIRSADSTVGLTSWGITGDFPHSVPDYDGDGKTDFGVQRSTQFWLRNSADQSINVIPWGLGSDFVQSLDYDGDGRTDLANTRLVGSERQWWVRSSLVGGPLAGASGRLFGSTVAPSSRRVAADYNGDGRTEIAIWKADTGGGTGNWWTLDVKTGAITVTPWGIDGDIPPQSAYWK